jgi:hypothetical protein
MGRVSQSIKTYGRRAGYRLGGAAGTAVGKMTGTSIGEKLGRRVGHQLGKAAGSAAGTMASKAYEKLPVIGSMKKGGPVKRTGKYLLHKGEYVLNKRSAKKLKYM